MTRISCWCAKRKNRRFRIVSSASSMSTRALLPSRPTGSGPSSRCSSSQSRRAARICSIGSQRRWDIERQCNCRTIPLPVTGIVSSTRTRTLPRGISSWTPSGGRRSVTGTTRSCGRRRFSFIEIPWISSRRKRRYYHRDGKAAFAGYFSGLGPEERLLRLIDDPWLLGTARDRIGAFLPWLGLPNVVPVSFEELVGPRGGGDAEQQSRVIWSIQLKLHVPGAPDSIRVAGVRSSESDV